VDIILLLRIAITLTFLLLAAGGPFAIVQLRRFVKLYAERHRALEVRVAALEHRLGLYERQEPVP
jgi:hypothetical protein